MKLGDGAMAKKGGKFARADEIPICPFCDGKVYYTSWITHRIFQMECESCEAHWRTGLKRVAQRDMYIELTRPMSNGIGKELLSQKLSLEFWRDLIRERIRL